MRVARPRFGVRGLLGRSRSPLVVPPVPDLLLDFETGAGIPVANGGAGGPGADTIELIASQDAGGNSRLVRALRYWDTAAPWVLGEPLFVPKQVGRLVGWPGPRPGGYWAGGGYWYTSTSETVAVYSSQAGLTVTSVAGGVVGPDAIRCDVAAGQSGADWHVTPAPVLTSGWTAYDGPTVVFAHAVVEVLDELGAWEPKLVLRDVGAEVDRTVVTHKFTDPPAPRSTVHYRGVGPHGGQLYEWYGIARLLEAPVGPLHGRLYLLRAHGSTPARSMVIHGAQLYLATRWDEWPVYWPVPFFSHARGNAVSWIPDTLRAALTTQTYTVGISALVPALRYADNWRNYGIFVSINGAWEESYYEFNPNVFRGDWETYLSPTGAFQNRAVVGVDSNYRRWLTFDGNTIVDGNILVAPRIPRSYIEFGQRLTAECRQFALWRRKLTDAEMRAAFKALVS